MPIIVELPLVEATISAGFPSTADDYSEARLDLNKELISNESATFYTRVRGDSMTLAGISNVDLLIKRWLYYCAFRRSQTTWIKNGRTCFQKD